MKNIFKSTSLFVISVFLSGCIQIETRVNVNKDGSGTVEETVLMSNEMVQMLNEFMSGFASDTAETGEFKLYNEEDLRKRETNLGDGVKLISGSEYNTENKQGYKAVYSFTDLSKLKIDQNPESRVPDDESNVEAEEKNYITFSFTNGDISELKIDFPMLKKHEDEEEFEAAEDSLNDNYVSEMQFFLKDLSFSLIVNVNGKIMETNATHIDGSEITLFAIKFGEVLNNKEKLLELKNIDPYNPKELKEVMKDIPGIKIETNDPVSVKFR